MRVRPKDIFLGLRRTEPNGAYYQVDKVSIVHYTEMGTLIYKSQCSTIESGVQDGNLM